MRVPNSPGCCELSFSGASNEVTETKRIGKTLAAQATKSEDLPHYAGKLPPHALGLAWEAGQDIALRTELASTGLMPHGNTVRLHRSLLQGVVQAHTLLTVPTKLEKALLAM